MYIEIRICIYTYIHISTYIYTYTYTHVCNYIYMYMNTCALSHTIALCGKPPSAQGLVGSIRHASGHAGVGMGGKLDAATQHALQR